MAVQVLPSEFGMSPERLAALMKDSWSPLDTLGRGQLAIAQLKNQQDFERERDAARFANEAALQKSQIQQSSTARTKELEAAEKMRSRYALEQQARAYRVPTTEDGKPRPDEDITSDIQDKALKAAQTVKQTIDTANTRIDAQLKDLYNYKPNIALQQQRAMQMALNDPSVAAAAGNKAAQDMRDAYAKGTLDLHALQTGVGTWFKDHIPGNFSKEAAAAVQSAYASNLQKVQDLDQQNYAANAQAKQKALLDEKARIVAPLTTEYYRHRELIAPEDLSKLDTSGDQPQPTKKTPEQALGDIANRNNAGTTPPPTTPKVSGRYVPGAGFIPDSTVDSSSAPTGAGSAQSPQAQTGTPNLGSVQSNLSDYARGDQSREAARQIVQLLNPEATSGPWYQTMGSGFNPTANPPYQSGLGAWLIGNSRGIDVDKLNDYLSKSKVSPDVAAKVRSLIPYLMSGKDSTNAPAQSVPSQIVPQQQPTSSIDPKTQQLGQIANMLAMRDGIPMEHIQDISAAARNPQDPGHGPAVAMVQHYYQRAQDLLSQSDNISNGFRATAQQPQSDDQPEDQPA